MGLLWRVAVPNIEDRQKCDGSKYTWGDYSEQVAHAILRRHKHAELIICVNDPYDQQQTIKDSERLLRDKNAPISNVYMKWVDKFPAMKDFHLLLGKSENKIRLQTFLESGFYNSAERSAVEIIYCVGDSAANLSIWQFV